jgi:hypothetical protein
METVLVIRNGLTEWTEEDEVPDAVAANQPAKSASAQARPPR